MTEVLIVGSGPTGLALASTLARYGVSARIIDKNPGPCQQSRAFGIQAGTLETLEDVFGEKLPRELIEAGYPARKGYFHFGAGAPLEFDLSTLPSAYAFILIIPQSETERLLEKNLGEFSVQVERSTELLSLSQGDDRVVCHVKNSDGSTGSPESPESPESIEARYVVGCDGAHSVVRHQLAVPFEGGSYSGDFILGDVSVDWPWEHGKVRTFISNQGALACFPMRGESRYRIVLLLKEGPRDATPEISLEEFAAVVNRLAPAPVRVRDPKWLTRFRVHHRMVKKFRAGRVFLAGDAAHIHSPVGGQGMNTGIQDAIHLGHRLARVLLDGADPSVLDEYERDRKKVAHRVLLGTDLASRLTLKRFNPLMKLTPILLRLPLAQKLILTTVSEIRIARTSKALRDASPVLRSRTLRGAAPLG